MASAIDVPSGCRVISLGPPSALYLYLYGKVRVRQANSIFSEVVNYQMVNTDRKMDRYFLPQQQSENAVANATKILGALGEGRLEN
ncbi:uncharacterized protein Z520_11723 [Fonsecaea multimorphosa CBS 102226]|uniref:Uncharacterized protein n=1 Tax=Fonsecaea multimorphosa CBS 102226 TaxID=1442371 RepID=A0A0D2JH95_9EURO|nr:uncharacterized protein Z520_11723 [Fonsecaea multimorphosa CBS 102226]KIX92547.1 hypothetical protein Z520_11723 [Fonsecaea multimorphosa CBS 102226]